MKTLLLTLICATVISNASAIVTPPSQSIPAGSTPRNPIAPSNEQFCYNASNRIEIATQDAQKMNALVQEKKYDVVVANDAARKAQDELKKANDKLKQATDESNRARDNYMKLNCPVVKAVN